MSQKRHNRPVKWRAHLTWQCCRLQVEVIEIQKIQVSTMTHFDRLSEGRHNRQVRVLRSESTCDGEMMKRQAEQFGR
jgi:hypothetical protein